MAQHCLFAFGAGLLMNLVIGVAAEAKPAPLTSTQKRLLTIADDLLEEANISYVYGGYQLGDSEDCRLCNECLSQKAPAAHKRLSTCSVCKNCSLDCSHFTELIYRQSGLPYPYMETARMLRLSPASLKENYQLIDVGNDYTKAVAGDLLVYKGHVVMLERLHDPKFTGGRGVVGDIVHATGGRDIKGPGMGIQRERFINPGRFRGALLRILRHEEVHKQLLQAKAWPANSAKGAVGN